MTITNITPRETELQRELSLARGEASVWKDQVTYDQAELKTVWRMNDALKAEVAELKADNENLRAYAKHERSLGAEAFAMENLDLTQQVEILKAKLAEAEKRLHMLLMPVPAKNVTALEVCKVVSERAMEIIQLLKGAP